MTQLPAHLQQYQVPDIGAALSANLGSAMPPHVSIEGGRFTLVDASNNEIPVPTFDPKIGVYLDGCIIDVNEHMSRMYYIKDYDPSAAGAPPDCWSDNGVAASISASSVPLLQPPHPRAGQPAATCAECPMAVWGSKVSNLGSRIPACSQKQKVALLVPGYPTLFLLAVPPNSHKFLREYTALSRGNGINIADVITRISFVPGVQGTLQFHAINYIDAPTAQLRQAAYVEKKTDALVGRNDVPRTAALAAPVQQPVQQVQQTAPFVPPAVAQPAPTASGQFPNPSGTLMNPNTASPAGGAMSASPSEGAAPARRRRRTAAEMAGGAQPGPDQQTAQAAPQAPFPVQGTPATAAAAGPGFPVSQQPGALPGQTDMGFGIAQGQPAAGNPEVSQMLDNFFKQG